MRLLQLVHNQLLRGPDGMSSVATSTSERAGLGVPTRRFYPALIMPPAAECGQENQRVDLIISNIKEKMHLSFP